MGKPVFTVDDRCAEFWEVQMKLGFIDPPTPFCSLERWEQFAAEMERFQYELVGAADLLREAREMIAEKRRECRRHRKGCGVNSTF